MKTTWTQLKRAAEDLQKMLGVKPPLTIAVKVNDVKLREWIQQVIDDELIEPGDEFQDTTIQVLADEFSFEMPEWGESEEEEPEEYDPDEE